MTHLELFFIGILILLATTDHLTFWIPNAIILPAILMGAYLTHNWLWMGIMFLMGTVLFARHLWAGGDVKLLALIGAFLGWQALVVGGCVIIALIRAKRRNQGQKIAVAPYFLLFSVLAIFATKATSLYLLWSR